LFTSSIDTTALPELNATSISFTEGSERSPLVKCIWTISLSWICTMLERLAKSRFWNVKVTVTSARFASGLAVVLTIIVVTGPVDVVVIVVMA
jgi:hypothetical protein